LVQLDVDQERQKLEQALAPLVAQGGVEIRWLEQATLQALQRELRRDEYHVFHYIGHGGYDRATDDGVLVLEDADGRRPPRQRTRARDDARRRDNPSPRRAQRVRRGPAARSATRSPASQRASFGARSRP